MRLSDWRGRAPHTEVVAPKVLAVIEPVLLTLGAGTRSPLLDRVGRRPCLRYHAVRADRRRDHRTSTSGSTPPGRVPGQAASSSAGAGSSSASWRSSSSAATAS